MFSDQSPEFLARLAQQRLRKKQRRSAPSNKRVLLPKQSASQQQGSIYEQKAVQYLQQQGLEILEQNLLGPMGEIDIVARSAHCLVFVEVRYRKNKHFGGALHSIEYRKQQRIIRTAHYFLSQLINYYCFDHTPFYRFDVIAFEGQSIHWIQNAFS